MPIVFPPASPGDQPIEMIQPCRVVVVGANGTGKTRLGAWLETRNQDNLPVHRIAAQKALKLPDFAQVKSLEQAQKELFYGRSDEHGSVSRKNQDRWGGNPATHFLSDYDKLLAVLFAMESDRDRAHTQQTRDLQSYIPVPESPIDTIVRLWTYLMPHRVVSFADGKVMVGKGTVAEYHAKEMSDGERVTLYLLGQCLTAPNGSLIIIDEPELHLHRSLMDKLWNKVEELCPDKSIVYITHDLEFAASRIGATKIWVKSYDRHTWTWANLPNDQHLPESLVLEIVGSRKPLLFCEGERGGLDHSIYQVCYPDHHVIPRGSAEKVAESVKAINDNRALHAFTAVGLIDRDVKTSEELAALERQGIYALPFAEVENLLCNARMVRAVAESLTLDPNATAAAVLTHVLRAFREEYEVQVALKSARRIRYHLSCYAPTQSNREGLQGGIDRLVQGLDSAEIIAESERSLQQALDSGDLDAVLRVYNRKSLASRISQCFGLQQGEYPALVLRLLKGGQSATYIETMSQVLPVLISVQRQPLGDGELAAAEVDPAPSFS